MCKSISEKYSIYRKCYFPERKMFSCVWLYFKKCFGKYFLIFGCVLENTIENTFSTCCSHFLTFSQLPNNYIISFISQNTNKTQKKSIGEIAIARRSKRRSRSTLPRQPVMSEARCVDHDRAKLRSRSCFRLSGFDVFFWVLFVF